VIEETVASDHVDEVDLRHQFQTLLGDRERDSLVSELYHENAKQVRSDLGFYRRIEFFNHSEVGFRLTQRTAKQYACGHRLALPEPDASPDLISVTEAISARASTRKFGGGPITLVQISTLLKFANGILGDTQDEPLARRAIPSGGGLYPTEVYMLPLDVPGLVPGAYHYDVFAHQLTRFHDQPAEPVLSGAGRLDGAVETAAVAFAISACFERQSVKYGERAYRFTLLECGHLAQNLLLVGTALGLGTLPVGGFIDSELDAYLGLDGRRESLLYLVLMGTSMSRAR
jgi:SagB-type dehydrogenase family enzyme